MKNVFPGFPAEGMKFLRDLKKHNDREWFTPRKIIYEEHVRLPMLALIEAAHREMLKFAPEYVGEPAKCIFRLYRDTRFSKDKTPYKTHIGAYFWRNDLDKNTGAGFYVGVSPEEVVIAAGLYHPAPDVLRTVREAVAQDHKAFRKTFENSKVRDLFGELRGDAATRAPKGFDPDHPALDLLKCRQYVLYPTLDPSLAAKPDLLGEVVTRFKAATPFLEFLNRPLKRNRNSEFI
jgi:uncharacterized protein (TIGR02453 family)